MMLSDLPSCPVLAILVNVNFTTDSEEKSYGGQ
jgi:hypothetical protein